MSTTRKGGAEVEIDTKPRTARCARRISRRRLLGIGGAGVASLGIMPVASISNVTSVHEEQLKDVEMLLDPDLILKHEAVNEGRAYVVEDHWFGFGVTAADEVLE